MNRKTIESWIAVNGMMDDDYREKIVADALEYYSQASPELRRFALGILKKAIRQLSLRFQHASQPPDGRLRRESDRKQWDTVWRS